MLLYIWFSRFPYLSVFSGHTNLVDCIDCDDEYAVTGSRDQSVRIWNIADGAQVIGAVCYERARPSGNSSKLLMKTAYSDLFSRSAS